MDLDTTVGDNWTVVVFDIKPQRWKDILVKLFHHFTQLKEALIPHYTVRGYSKPPRILLRISFRILRKIEDEPKIIGEITEFMESAMITSYGIDPKEGDVYGSHHAWIRKAKNNIHWSRKRCIILNQMSSLVVKVAENDVFNTNCRAEWAHLAINMLGMHEAVKDSRSYYFDVLTGDFKGPYLTIKL